MTPAASITTRESTPATFRRPWTLVIVLTAIYAYAFMDRVILGLLVEPIKADLRASDTQMGLLIGLGFAASYTLANLPAGYIVDRLDRRALIGAASLAWAGMTLVCALAGGIDQMFAGRAGVGLAEAVIGPAAFSLIRDAVSERARGTAFSIYAMAPLIGGATALIGGGALLHAAEVGALGGLNSFAEAAPWRVVLGLVGLLGLPVSLLLLTFHEPARRDAEPTEPRGDGLADDRDTSRQTLAHIRRNFAVYVPLVAYVTFAAMMSFGQSAWLPAMLGRKWAVAPDRIGPMLGGLTLVCGLTGLLLTGFLLRRMAAAGRDIRGFGALASLGTAIGLAGSAIAPSLETSLCCAGVGLFFVGASYPIGATTLSSITPARLMGRVAAGYLLCQTLLGQALGPALIAFSSAHFVAGQSSLSLGFGIMMTLFGVASAVSAIILRQSLAHRTVTREAITLAVAR